MILSFGSTDEQRGQGEGASAFRPLETQGGIVSGPPSLLKIPLVGNLRPK
jgi:hypothetical protein